MKLRHAAALAGLGWYLMVPPSVHHGSDVITALEPLNKWLNLHSFDTAATCEATRQTMIDSYKKTLDTDPADEHALKGFNSFSDSECIASDDPRLKCK